MYALVMFNVEQDDPGVASTAPLGDGAQQPGVASTAPLEDARGVPRGGAGVNPTPPYLQPPTSETREEEGVASAPSADAPVAAPLDDLFSPDMDTATVSASSVPPSPPSGGHAHHDPTTMLPAVAAIAKHTGRGFDDPDRLAQALADTQARSGWSLRRLTARCIEKLNQPRTRPIDDSVPWLAADLRRVTASTGPSQWVQNVEAYNDLINRLDPDGDDDDGGVALDLFADRLADAAVIVTAAQDRPSDALDVDQRNAAEAVSIGQNVLTEDGHARRCGGAPCLSWSRRLLR